MRLPQVCPRPNPGSPADDLQRPAAAPGTCTIGIIVTVDDIAVREVREHREHRSATLRE
jgi:hypothetical protein